MMKRRAWPAGLVLSLTCAVGASCSGEATDSTAQGGRAGTSAGGVGGSISRGGAGGIGGAPETGGSAGEAEGGAAITSAGGSAPGGDSGVDAAGGAHAVDASAAGQGGIADGGAGAGAGGHGGEVSNGGSGTGTGGSGPAACAVAGELRCAGQCTDVLSSRSHCGACNQACAAGFVCSAGACACAAGLNECAGVCADFKTDALHCGNCSTACVGRRVCEGATCVCAAGQSVCGDTCLDLKTNAENCGACGKACGLGEGCTAGQCVVVPGGALAADSCVGLADGLTLSTLSLMQSVEIPIMRNGAEVAVASRNADVVAGREALVRFFATVDSAWKYRTLSGRLFVENAGHVDLYFAKKTLFSGSTFGSWQSSFEMRVPKEKINAETKYRVEVVECGRAATGPTAGARFPDAGGLSLGARATGGLKVKVVPVRANGLLPDTSVAALEVYKAALLAMYPIATAEVSVSAGAALEAADANDWNAMLDQVRARRAADQAPNDVYYYGMLKPAATQQEYCAGKTPCTAGLGYLITTGTASAQASLRAGIGLAFADGSSSETLLHELGHNHGRLHAPCSAGTIEGVDASYPYSSGRIGVYGWNSRSGSVVDNYAYDVMGYCAGRWISDYTYAGILNRIASVNGALASEIVPPELVRPWRVLLVDRSLVRWGAKITRPAPPAGVPEWAEVLDAGGRSLGRVTVYRNALPDIEGASIQVPEPSAGWFSIRVEGAAPIAWQ